MLATGPKDKPAGERMGETIFGSVLRERDHALWDRQRCPRDAARGVPRAEPHVGVVPILSHWSQEECPNFVPPLTSLNVSRCIFGPVKPRFTGTSMRSEEHTSELQSRG